MQTLKAQYEYSNHSNQVNFFNINLLEDYNKSMHFCPSCCEHKYYYQRKDYFCVSKCYKL